MTLAVRRDGDAGAFALVFIPLGRAGVDLAVDGDVGDFDNADRRQAVRQAERAAGMFFKLAGFGQLAQQFLETVAVIVLHVEGARQFIFGQRFFGFGEEFEDLMRAGYGHDVCVPVVVLVFGYLLVRFKP